MTLKTEWQHDVSRIYKWLVTSSLLSLLSPSVAFAQASVTVTYYYTDQQGTPLATADASGNVISKFDYKPYGSVSSGSPTQGPGYTGHIEDADSGLVYMQARYYDPDVGRFLSTDPKVGAAGNVNSFGRYGYANMNPVSNIDPDGRGTIAIGAGGTLAALAGVTGSRQITFSMQGLHISTFNIGYYNTGGGTASSAIGPSANILLSYSAADSAAEMADTSGSASAGGGVNILGASLGYDQSICDLCKPIRTITIGGKIPQLPFEAHASVTQSVGYTIFGFVNSPTPTVKVGEIQPSNPPPPPPPPPLVPSDWAVPIL